MKHQWKWLCATVLKASAWSTATHDILKIRWNIILLNTNTDLLMLASCYFQREVHHTHTHIHRALSLHSPTNSKHSGTRNIHNTDLHDSTARLLLLTLTNGLRVIIDNGNRFGCLIVTLWHWYRKKQKTITKWSPAKLIDSYDLWCVTVLPLVLLVLLRAELMY